MKFRIYSKDHCPYCIRAAHRLSVEGLDFEELKLNEDFTRDELLAKFPNAKTFPQIQLQVEGRTFYVGGHDQLMTFLD